MKGNIKKISALLIVLCICMSFSGCNIFLDGLYISGIEDIWEYEGFDDENSYLEADSQVEEERASAIQNGTVRSKFVTPIGNNRDIVTIMIYMCGSDLESYSGYATMDIKEMISAQLSDNVNLIIQTGGTKAWHNSQISSKTAQRFQIKDNQLVLIEDNLGQLDTSDEQTLEDFISFCGENYPANRNILIFWDHGSGPVYGFGGDEYQDVDAALRLDEIQQAVKNSGILFDFIGFDACIMGSIEVAYALSDYADYLIASEDFESAYGWGYTNWLTLLGENSSVDTPTLAKTVINDFIDESNECDSSGILTLVDLSFAKLLFNAWTEFAYSAENELLEYDYTFEFHRSSRALKSVFGFDSNDIYDEYSYNITDVNAIDITAVASAIDIDESEALKSAMNTAVVYSAATSEDKSMSGLHVTLPYDDPELYELQKEIYSNCGISDEYIAFAEAFTGGASSSYNWDSWEWDGSDYQ